MLGRLRAILHHIQARFRTRRTVKEEISRWTMRQNAVDAKSLSETHDNDNKPPNSHYTKERRVGVLPECISDQKIAMIMLGILTGTSAVNEFSLNRLRAAR
jgi:hypothetical protein